jgi:hypothetical protein
MKKAESFSTHSRGRWERPLAWRSGSSGTSISQTSQSNIAGQAKAREWPTRKTKPARQGPTSGRSGGWDAIERQGPTSGRSGELDAIERQGPTSGRSGEWDVKERQGPTSGRSGEWDVKERQGPTSGRSCECGEKASRETPDRPLGYSCAFHSQDCPEVSPCHARRSVPA